MRLLPLVAVLLTACASVDPPEAAAPACPTPLIARGDLCVPNVATCDETELPTTAGSCVTVGVDVCDDGFEPDTRGGCRAILPAECPPGQLAIPGDVACRAVDDCTGVPPADAIFVDASATGGGDGSPARPFGTIAAALAAANTHEGTPTIAIAKGSYNEQLIAQHAVRIVGACASSTEIVAPDAPGSFAFASAFPFELKGIAVRGGDAAGIVLVGNDVSGAPAESVAVVERVWVRGTKGPAIGAQTTARPLRMTIRDSLIENVNDTGVAFVGAEGMVERTVIRRVSPARELPAYGLYLGGARPKLTIKSSVIESTEHGIGVLSGEARVEGTLLRELRPDGGRQSSVGISADGASSRLHVSGSVIERVSLAGVLLLRGAAVIERTTLTEVFPGGDLGVGEGVHVGHSGALVMRRSLVHSTVAQGVFLGDGEATLEKVIVRDTQPRVVEKDFGAGIAAQPDKATSHLTLREVMVRTTRVAGVQINGATLDIESAFINDVRAQQMDGLFGDALALQSSIRRSNGELLVGTANVTGLVVRNAKRAGIGVFGAELTLSASVLECNAIDLALSGRFDSSGIAENRPVLRDGGNNLCGCGTFGVCKARSEGLVPSPHLNE